MTRFFAFTIALPVCLLAQVRVPFVGCNSDGQVGPLAAPAGVDQLVQIDAGVAGNLAYYKAENDSGVLAPRGWYCFGVYGSNGASVFVTPEPIRRDDLFSDKWRGFPGPAIQASSLSGETSGRFSVAREMARVFPKYRAFVERVIAEGFEPASDFPFGPYPGDRLVYKSDQMVEFQTPANSEGLGTMSRLQKNGQPIHGVSILEGETPDLLRLTVRLPETMKALRAAILQDFENESASQH